LDCTDQIKDIKKFREKIARTGMQPSKTLPDMICDEIYKCDEKEPKAEPEF
jgi:hypothetical protein